MVRPYILDCLCEHNELSKKEQEQVHKSLGNENQATNFESDNRRTSNPYKYKPDQKREIKENYPKLNSEKFDKYEKSEEKKKLVGIISQHASPGVREIGRDGVSKLEEQGSS